MERTPPRPGTRWPWGLRTQLAAVVTVAVLASQAIVAPVLITRGSDALRGEVLADSMNAADRVADFTSVYADGAQRAVRTLATRPGLVRSMLDDNPEAQGLELQRFLELNPSLDSIGIIDARTIMRVSGVPTSPAIGTSNADRDYYQAAMATGKPSLGIPVLSRGTGRAIIPYGVPILDDGGKPLGVLAGGISTLALHEAVADVRGDRAARALVVDRRNGGMILAHSDPTLVLKPLGAQPEVLGSILAGELASLETTATTAGGQAEPADGANRVLAGYAPVRGLPWSVVVEQPIEAALAPIAQRHDSDVLLVVLSILVALVLGGLTALRISNPIMRLRDAAHDLAGGDLQRRVNFTQRDEIGELGRAFDTMAASLQTRIELEAANRELEGQYRHVQEANRIKSQFLANMSHELRTPLNSIIGFSQLIYDDDVEPIAEGHRAYLSFVLTSAQHLLQLINDVLDLAKVEAGKMEFRPETVELGKLVGEVCGILRTMASEKRLRIEPSIAPELATVVADPGRLKQVLYNYLSNAIKFTPADGTIAVRLQPEGAAAYRLEVEDTGIGIAPDQMHRLFNEFEQLDSGTTKRYQGTGLGLALTKRIVEAQGGTVGVRSTPGVGSTFFAVLPRVMHSDEVEVAMPSPTVGFGAPTVLVIDDNATDRAWLARELDAAGYAVVPASTGAEAMNACQTRAFEAITLDLLLPDLSGAELLQQIRTSALNRDTAVIVTSVVAQAGLALGFADHDCLLKPIRSDELRAALRRGAATP